MSSLARFLRYVKIDTQSSEKSETVPSTKKQLNLARLLYDELLEMGLVDVKISEYGYVSARLPSNVDYKVPTIGFIAHMDTSPDLSGKDVKPLVWENYHGNDLHLPSGDILSVTEFPFLKSYQGQTLITTSGDTLLGADDKSGITIIMEGFSYLKNHPEILHGELALCFTPDEEIGRGADFFDVKDFACDFAYTFDGGEVGELEYESFNAAKAKLVFYGKNIHPGQAKGKMNNAIEKAALFATQMPPSEKPEFTSGREGFYHLHDMSGNVEQATLDYIIRDFSTEDFLQRKKFLKEQVRIFQDKYDITINCEIKDQYYNMYEILKNHPQCIEYARQALKEEGISPIERPIRGGTDGSSLSFKGLPCPNLFAGGHNFHGKYECIALESIEKGKKVLVRLANIVAISA